MRIDEISSGDGPSFSFEFFPPRDPEGVEGLFETIERLRPLEPDYVSVTYGAGGATRDGTLEISTRIKRECGIETMAHLSCVGETTEGLVQILDRLEAEGIENVLALRGDPPRGEPDFEPVPGGLSSAAELAAFIAARYDFALAGSCFPEVHRDAPSLEADLAYLKTKVEAGVGTLITQLFYDNRVFWDWLAEARRAGIEVPIMAGVMPITSYAQIRRITELCDAHVPAPLAAALEACEGDRRAETELGIAYATRQCEELLAGGIEGIHFYTLNRAPATRAVLGALRAARPWERATGTGARAIRG
jgi:methylenetetrahydrofolate reductase (NADPH)